MKFSVGYQIRNDDRFIKSIVKNKEFISEVYFAFGDFANGRNSQIERLDMTPWEAQARQNEDIAYLAENGLAFNLLFNATCYGGSAQSRAFYNKIGQMVEYIASRYRLNGVTTTSPLIARFIKENFDGIDVRASVNMGIGTVEGMQYVSQYFDSFYLKRELNRNFLAIESLKKWCDENGKRLYALVNSGCLNNCSAHVFHDNLVSHESEISKMDNGYAFEGVCRTYLSDPKNASALLDNTGFIRPEDISLYEGLFTSMKLATRVSLYPEKILKAYIEDGTFSGSTLDLLEPNHPALLYPRLLENRKISASINDGKLVYGNLENALITLE